MPSTSDTYTAAQAAELLGVSERRVRQLVAEGKLPSRKTTDGTVRLLQRAVNEERKKRRVGSLAASRKSPGTLRSAKASTELVNVEALADAVAAAVGHRLEGQLEITRRAESLIRSELDEERARRIQLEAQLADLEHQLAEAQDHLGHTRNQLTEATRRRGLFRRGSAGN